MANQSPRVHMHLRHFCKDTTAQAPTWSCGNGLLLSLLIQKRHSSIVCIKISGSRCLSEVSGKGSEMLSLLVSRNVAKLISVFAKLQE